VISSNNREFIPLKLQRHILFTEILILTVRKFFRIGMKSLAVVVGFLILLIVFINLPFSKKIVTRQVNGLFTKLELPLNIHAIKAAGLRSFKVEGFSITDPHGDTIIYAGNVRSKYHLLALTRSKVKLSDTKIAQARVKLLTNEETGKLAISEAFKKEKKKKPAEKGKKKASWEISSQNIDLKSVFFLMNDLLEGTHIYQEVEDVRIKRFNLSLLNRELTARNLELSNTKGDITLDPPAGKKKRKDQKKKDKQENPKGPPWKFDVRKLSLRNINFAYVQKRDSLMLKLLLDKGVMATNQLDFYQKIIDVDELSLDGLQTGIYTGQSSGNKENSLKSGRKDFPWDIKTAKLDLKNVSAETGKYGLYHADSASRYLAAEDLELRLRDLQLSMARTGMDLKKLSLNLNNGFSLKKMLAELDSDSESTSMELALETGNSQFMMESGAGESFFDLLNDPEGISDLMVRINHSRVSVRDIYSFIPGLKEIPVLLMFEKVPLDLAAQVDKREDRYTLSEFSLSSGRKFDMSVNGFAENPIDSAEVYGEVDLEVSEINIPWLKEVLAATGLESGIADSSVLSLEANVTNVFSSPNLSLILKLNRGLVEVKGLLDYKKQRYDVNSRFSQLELGEILADSLLGAFSGSLELSGSGFSTEILNSDLSLVIDSFRYNGYDYTRTGIKGTIRPGYYSADIRANDPAIHGNLNASLLQADSMFEAKAAGTLFAQLDHLNYFNDTLAVESNLTANFLKNRDAIESNIFLDDVKITSPRDFAELSQFSAFFKTDSQKTTLTGESDFFNVDLQIGIPVDEVERLGQCYGDYLRTFIDPEDSISENRLSNLPEVSATGKISYHNSLGVVLENPDLYFKDLDFTLSHQSPENRLRYHLQGRDIEYASAKFGWLDLALVDSAGAIDLSLLADSSSLFSDPVNTIKLNSRFLQRRSLSEFKVLDTLGSTTYNLEFSTEIDSNEMVVKIPSREFLINKQPWLMESAELLRIDLNTGILSPMLNLSNDSSSLYFRNILEEGLNTYKIDLHQVNLNSILPPDLLPGDPRAYISGSFEYEISDNNEKKISTDLNLTQARFSDLSYEEVRFDGFFAYGDYGDYKVDLYARLDSAEISLAGEKTDTLNSDIQGEFSRIPLNTMQPFTEEHLSDMTGTISGNVSISRSAKGRNIGGQLMFKDASMKVNTINSSYSIPDQSISFTNKQLTFNEFSVLDSLGKSLVVDGILDFRDNKPVTADLNISSSNLQVMNTGEEDNNSFYGRIFVDSEFSVEGPVKKPTVEGRILLSNNTEVFYTQRDDLSLSESERTVSFVSPTKAKPDPIEAPIASPGVFIESSIETIVEIDPSTVLNFNLSKRIYDIGLKIQGGGLLNYNMLNNNQISLSGSFEISSGAADLKLVGWPDKSFRITQGGFVRWSGRIDNPQLDLEAVNTVATSYVNPVDGKSREVDFNVLLKLSNHLSDLDIALTISTPDQYLMSIINTMSPEEQMQQAFSVLLFELIDLPGISSSSDYVTQQVNQILAAQLNQLTASTIKGVEISFGLDTYNQNQGSQESSTSLSYEVKKSLLNNRAEIEVSGRLHDVNEQPGSQDLSLTNVSFAYRLDSAATKYLKVYNEHTYEDVFEGEVIKTGVGFTYRKRYRTFRDIWRRKNKNKKIKPRAE